MCLESGTSWCSTSDDIDKEPAIFFRWLTYNTLLCSDWTTLISPRTGGVGGCGTRTAWQHSRNGPGAVLGWCRLVWLLRKAYGISPLSWRKVYKLIDVATVCVIVWICWAWTVVCIFSTDFMIQTGMTYQYLYNQLLWRQCDQTHWACSSLLQ